VTKPALHFYRFDGIAISDREEMLIGRAKRQHGSERRCWLYGEALIRLKEHSRAGGGVGFSLELFSDNLTALTSPSLEPVRKLLADLERPPNEMPPTLDDVEAALEKLGVQPLQDNVAA
jgi:hypothetical protein